MLVCVLSCCLFFTSRRRHTRCALVTGVQTCALPISGTCVDRTIVGTAEGTEVLAREAALRCRKSATVAILIGENEVAAAPLLPEELADLHFGPVAVGGAGAQYRFGAFNPVAEATIDDARNQIGSTSCRDRGGPNR